MATRWPSTQADPAGACPQPGGTAERGRGRAAGREKEMAPAGIKHAVSRGVWGEGFFLGCTLTIQSLRLTVAAAAPPGRVTAIEAGVFASCGEQGGLLGLHRLVRASGAGGKGDKMEGCRVMEGGRCLRRHPSILAYTSKGHTYSMTGPLSQLSRSSRPAQPPAPHAPASPLPRGWVQVGDIFRLVGTPPMQ